MRYDVAIGLLNDGPELAQGDERLQTLIAERMAALERRRIEALEKARSCRVRGTALQAQKMPRRT